MTASEIDTKGYQSLLSLKDNTAGDSFDLYYGLFMYNPNSIEELERLEEAFSSVKQLLFNRLHGVVRKELFKDTAPTPQNAEPPSLLPAPMLPDVIDVQSDTPKGT
ncbi:hypothetical protein CYMTET_30073 [Cymbomonas tetramitiformis]|uniref:TYRAAT2-like C-terminal domain-containing protein n=1 Tax=Cymbomonas tetramitiformis TaxID=36881 RepID=A0AAE0KUA8_9CHLO|nr:hypothetical protein CYMTET_30073 [Cymbomonas tetramitiformis]